MWPVNILCHIDLLTTSGCVQIMAFFFGGGMIMNLEVPFLDQLNVCPKFFIFIDLPHYLFQFKRFAKPSCSLLYTSSYRTVHLYTHLANYSRSVTVE